MGGGGAAAAASTRPRERLCGGAGPCEGGRAGGGPAEPGDRAGRQGPRPAPVPPSLIWACREEPCVPALF